MSGFTKYVPVTEDEYKRFKQQQQVLQTQQELHQPAPLTTLATAQNDKERELFSHSSNPELQEKRFKQLVHMINALKRQITASNSSPRFVENTHLTKADRFLNILGPQMWNEKDELVYKGEAIPQSSRKTLTDYAVSDWRTKFKTPPKGGAELKEIIHDLNIAPQYLGRGIQQKETVPSKKLKRLKHLPKAVDTPNKKRKTALGQNSSAKLANMVLSDPKAYRKLMQSK